jgi:hypothetical protein
MIVHSYWEFFAFRRGRRCINSDRDTVGVFIMGLDGGVGGWACAARAAPRALKS